MNNEFNRHFSWVRELLDQKLDNSFQCGSVEYEILQKMKCSWTADNGIELLKEMDETYGEAAKNAVAEFLKLNLLRDWAQVGEKEAHEGTEIDDFFRILWEPLQKTGFEFTRKDNGGVVELTVTRCPVFELAEKTGMHEWFYRIACTSDFYSTPSFSSEIGFIRTKTLMQGDECCNHTYYYKNSVTEDMRLGFCGLFCGNCPSYQKTDAAKPIDFNKEDHYEPCLGCNSGIKTSHCSNCEITKCNKSKNTRICYECSDFPCEVMDGFMNDARFPYHKYVGNNMMVLKEKGVTEWENIEKEKYTCKKCNTILNFFQNKCNNCGAPIDL